MALNNSSGSTNGPKMILNDQLLPKRDYLINGGVLQLQGGSSMVTTKSVEALIVFKDEI